MLVRLGNPNSEADGFALDGLKIKGRDELELQDEDTHGNG